MPRSVLFLAVSAVSSVRHARKIKGMETSVTLKVSRPKFISRHVYGYLHFQIKITKKAIKHRNG
jgi:hypothetical protein